MTKIFFRDLSRRFYLDLTPPVAGLAKGKRRVIAAGDITVMIDGKAVTKAKSLNGVTLEVVNLDGDLFVQELRRGSERVRIDVKDKSTFGNGPILTLGGDILLRKEADQDRSSVSCTLHRLDFGKPLPIGPGDTGLGFMRWRYDDQNDYYLYADDHHIGFPFRTSPLTGDLELALGEYKYGDTHGNRDPLRVGSGPYRLHLDPGFNLYFGFGPTDRPAQFLWSGAAAAMLELTGRGLDWLPKSNPTDLVYVHQVYAGQDVIGATRFAGSEIGIRIGTGSAAAAELNSSYVYGTADRFSWETGWPSGQSKYDEPANRLIYRDPDALKRKPSDPGFREELYRGVWVANLFDQNGGPARFDADVAILSKQANGRTFTFAAGGKLNGTPSILAPKFAPEDGAMVRVLDIPVERTAFLSARAADQPTTSPAEITFSFDYKDPRPHGGLKLWGTMLKTAPFDASAVAAGTFAHWTLAPPAGQACKLDYDEDGAQVPADFAENWTSVGATEFALASGGNGRIAVATASGQSALETDVRTGIRYARAAARLEFDREQVRSAGAADDIEIAKFEIDPAADPKWLVRNQGIGDLIYCCQRGVPGAPTEAQRLVDRIAGASGAEVFLKLEIGLKAALKLPKSQGEPDPPSRYWGELGLRARPTAKPGLAMDFSGEALAEPWALLGWSEADWKRFQSADPELWPAYGRNFPIGLDPSQGAWRGHLLRDFLISFPAKIKDDIRKYPALVRLYEQFESSLLLDYGWRDARGWTFHAGFAGTAPVEFFKWPGFVSLSLVDIQVAVGGSRLTRAQGRLRLVLPFLKAERKGALEDFSLDLGLTLADLGAGLQVQSLSLERPGTTVAAFRDPVPGVRGIAVSQVKTDLKTLALVGSVTLDDAAGKFFGVNEPIDVELSVPFNDDGGAKLECRLPEEKAAHLGGWGVTIRGLSLELDPKGPRSLEVTGSINLAVDGFVSVGFIARFETDDTVTFRITDFVGKLAVGGFALRINLGLVEENKARFFRGTADLMSSLTGQIGMQLKIGEQAGDSFWIGAIRKASKAQKFASFGALSEQTLVLGRRVERDQSNGALEKALLDPSGDKVYHATERNNDDVSWLNQWKYAEHIDFVIGASGFLGLDQIFMKPGGKRTGIMLTSGGYFRIEAHSNFFSIPIDYDLTLDTANEFIYAGFHAPDFTMEGGYKVSGGYVGAGLGYGKRQELALTVGWPFPTFEPNDEAPDWSRAVTVKWDDSFPLNTFAGGVMVHIAPGFTRLGLALRGGWTKSYKAKALGLEGKAELGVMLGGVVYFEFGSQNLSLAAPGMIAERLLVPSRVLLDQKARPPRLHLASALSAMVDGAFGEILAVDVEIRLALYADIWGEARVTFMGITLVGVRIDAHARINVRYYKQIYYAVARANFSVEVKIGCAHYSQSASFDVVFVDKPRPARLAGGNDTLPTQIRQARLEQLA